MNYWDKGTVMLYGPNTEECLEIARAYIKAMDFTYDDVSIRISKDRRDLYIITKKDVECRSKKEEYLPESGLKHRN